MRRKEEHQKDSAEKAVREIRRATRRRFSAEEKIRIVLEGLRGEESIAELCRREKINHVRRQRSNLRNRHQPPNSLIPAGPRVDLAIQGADLLIQRAEPLRLPEGELDGMPRLAVLSLSSARDVTLMRMVSEADHESGWFLPEDGIVFLEVDTQLVALTSQGSEIGRFAGPSAEAVRNRLRSRPSNSSLLDTLARVAPSLDQLLKRPTVRLSPDALLSRGHWGQLFVELTAQCNERCLHCYASAGPDRREALDHATVEALVRDAAALEFECVQFTGGEALMCPFLTEVAKLANDCKIPTVEVYTNGVLLNERRYAALREAGVSFAFSLYARSPQRHDAITKLNGSHALTVAAIRRAVRGGSPVRVGIIAARPEDEDEARMAGELAKELGVPSDGIGLDVSRGVGRGRYGGREMELADWDNRGESARNGNTHSSSRSGKAAVLPNGWVTPCIFSRELRLGEVGPDGGLRAALEKPAVHLRKWSDRSCVARELQESCSQFTCYECRVSTVLLGQTGEPAQRRCKLLRSIPS